MTDFCYVNILASVGHPEHFYVGLTKDISARLKKHNAGGVPHTAKFRPWRIKTALAFTEHERAAAFETYLKTSSGGAFTKSVFSHQSSPVGLRLGKPQKASERKPTE